MRGLVVDETITPQGRTFYTEFYGVWQSPPVDGFYTVEVREKPTPGRGALVRVFVNDDVTFQARLQPQTDIAERALQAARRTYGYVRSGQGILQIY
ncbi:curli production assembly/transport protein CsgE [Salinibacter ruber]|uniref:curli production assembly/transport protein CsgE n=1 Tax=Salinibacter ruber TaxID=146919 RepID=UPI002072E42A|nr:curli production assembly/transport protein CsgE [Salinibacter ruber]